MKPTIYLAGPIDGCSTAECTYWRQHIKATYLEFDYRDPMDRDYRGREVECCNEIVNGDKVDIKLADALLVWYSKPSVGTSMEVLYAWTLGKPVIVVAHAGTFVSPWMRYHAMQVVPSAEQAIASLRALFRTGPQALDEKLTILTGDAEK